MAIWGRGLGLEIVERKRAIRKTTDGCGAKKGRMVGAARRSSQPTSAGERETPGKPSSLACDNDREGSESCLERIQSDIVYQECAMHCTYSP